jgi:tetratricopeptide (TPR) repeat protein
MRWPNTITTAAVGLFFVYGYLSFQQNSVWKSNLTLWQHTVSVSPRSVLAMENLGTIYYSMGEYAKALDVLYGIQQIEPLNPIYDFFEGKYFWERGDFPRATVSFEHAIGKKNNLIDALYYLAVICEKTKNLDCAISYYQRLLASNDLERGQYKKIAKERLAILGALNSPY